MTEYENYFKDHYHSSLTQDDLVTYHKWFYAQWQIIRRQLDIGQDSSVLEIGAGFGGFYQFLRQAGVTDYVGLELDKDAAEFANHYFDTDAFVVSPIEKFTSKKKFDYIFAFEVMEHVEDPSSVLRHIHSLLKPGGVFCGTSPYPYAKNVYADETHLSVLHPANWRRLIENAHFQEARLYPMSFLPFVWRVNSNLNVKLPCYIPFKGFIATTLFIATK